MPTHSPSGFVPLRGALGLMLTRDQGFSDYLCRDHRLNIQDSEPLDSPIAIAGFVADHYLEIGRLTQVGEPVSWPRDRLVVESNALTNSDYPMRLGCYTSHYALQMVLKAAERLFASVRTGDALGWGTPFVGPRCERAGVIKPETLTDRMHFASDGRVYQSRPDRCSATPGYYSIYVQVGPRLLQETADLFGLTTEETSETRPRRRGRPRGSGVIDDSASLMQMKGLLYSGQAQNVSDAAKRLAPHVRGASERSAADRLRQKYASWEAKGFPELIDTYSEKFKSN